MPFLLCSIACILAATCSAVGCRPDWIISAVSRSSPSTVIVFAITRPSLSDIPSTLTLSPGISTVSANCSLSRPKSPLSSFVLVSAVRTTVTFPPGPFTISVSPVRAMIIPLTSVSSALATRAIPNVSKHIAPRLTTIFIRTLCMTFSLLLSVSDPTRICAPNVVAATCALESSEYRNLPGETDSYGCEHSERLAACYTVKNDRPYRLIRTPAVGDCKDSLAIFQTVRIRLLADVRQSQQAGGVSQSGAYRPSLARHLRLKVP